MNTIKLVIRLHKYIKMKASSGSMEPALITSEYVCRMWGSAVEISEIEAAFALL